MNQVDFCPGNNLTVSCHPDGIRLWDSRRRIELM